MHARHASCADGDAAARLRQCIRGQSLAAASSPVLVVGFHSACRKASSLDSAAALFGASRRAGRAVGSEMADCGLDPDEITRWVLRKEYRLHRPTPEQISQYRYWHHVSRTRGFDVAGPWQAWPSKPIPPDATARMPLPAGPPASTKSGINQPAIAKSDPTSSPASPPAGNGRPRVKERAERCLREQLANGPRCGERVIAAAAEVDVSERTLIAAAERLGVRTRRGEWWLPGGA
jgi:hypothetical protein